MEQDKRTRLKRKKAVHRIVHGRNTKENGGIYRSLVIQSVAAGVVLLAAAALLSFNFSFSDGIKNTLKENMETNSNLKQVNIILEDFISKNKLLSSIFNEEQGIAVFGRQNNEDTQTEDKNKEDVNTKEDEEQLNLTRYIGSDETIQTMMNLDKLAEHSEPSIFLPHTTILAMGGQEAQEESEGPALPDDATHQKVALPVSLKVPVVGEVTSEFGYREHPINGVVSFHYGTDIAAESGTAIIAPAKGIVLEVGISPVYGKYLYLDHGDNLVTFYGHCSKILVEEGDTVKQGKTIAKVGNTGVSTGTHLHFGVRLNQIYVDPQYYI